MNLVRAEKDLALKMTLMWNRCGAGGRYRDSQRASNKNKIITGYGVTQKGCSILSCDVCLKPWLKVCISISFPLLFHVFQLVCWANQSSKLIPHSCITTVCQVWKGRFWFWTPKIIRYSFTVIACHRYKARKWRLHLTRSLRLILYNV